jgi:hypothetical protein
MIWIVCQHTLAGEKTAGKDSLKGANKRGRKRLWIAYMEPRL